MKKLINAIASLSLAIYVVPPVAQAQDMRVLEVNGMEVICLPDDQMECPEGALCVVSEVPDDCEAKAQKALEALTAQSAAEEEAAKAAEEQAAKAAEEEAAKAAEEEAAKAAEEEAAKAAEEEAAKAAEEEAAKAAEEEAAKAAEEEAAKAAEEEAAKAAEEEAAKAAEEEAAKAAETEAAEAATEQAVPEDAAPAPLEVTVADQVFVCLPDEGQPCPDGSQCVIGASEDDCTTAAQDLLEAATIASEPETAPAEEVAVPEMSAEDAAGLAAAEAAAAEAAAAAAADPTVEIIDAPVPTEEAVQTLEATLDASADPETSVEAPAPEATSAVDTGAVAEDGTVTLSEEIPVAEDATVTEEVVTEADARASTEEFAAAPATVAPGKKTGLSTFEKVGLVALGALIVGSMINGNRQVVSNTGDRVVVRQPDGSYTVYKDDNALLREPGSTVRTETFRDGSTRTVVTRQDGSQIVTIRDATGRVLQRVAYDRSGRGVVLIDDMVPEERIDVSRLPRVRADDYAFSVDDENAALRAALASAENEDLMHRFSLRQIRTIPEVRWLAPTIEVSNITFESGSAAIQASEAKKLKRLGRFILDQIDENPRSLFLIEGHTDAVGSAASNLTLSDRRAESVAKALTEFFDVPPENLVVQGYGESELKIDTQDSERKNRRVAVRIITDLLKRGAY